MHVNDHKHCILLASQQLVLALLPLAIGLIGCSGKLLDGLGQARARGTDASEALAADGGLAVVDGRHRQDRGPSVDSLGLTADSSGGGPDNTDGAVSDRGTGTSSTGCLRQPLPAANGPRVIVSTAAELQAAADRANRTGHLTVLLRDGTYELDGMLYIRGDHVTFRSQSGDRERVIVRGQGMRGSVSHVFNVAANHFTAADMTIGWVANHPVQIQGTGSGDHARLHNLRIVNAFEQLVKVSGHQSEDGADHGIMEYCLLEYPAGVGPQWYIGGIDAHNADNWIIRNNTFRNIRSPESRLAEHAIHFWSGSQNTLAENNVIINCDRGIGFGLGDRGHGPGTIRNNFVHTTRDVGIGLESCSGAQVYNNSLVTENHANSIEYRFSASRDNIVVNNLATAQIRSRDGGSARVHNNLSNAQPNWFVDATAGDLHLSNSVPAIVVDSGTTIETVTTDIDCQPRVEGRFDIGADER